ncbi:MAG: molybdate ABC transporter substrate-binding protein [Methanosarcinaceae archaeon]|nr:molybdate ABC transporter substrate-binding protein [Methanosarcinaceae archaeon]
MRTWSAIALSALILIIILVVSLAAGCITDGRPNTAGDGPYDGSTITLCCGAGLMKPMNEIISNFENDTGARVEVHYGGTGEIFGILASGKGDVFIPGSYYYTAEAMGRGYVYNDTVQNITLHIPAIVTSRGNPKNITGLEDLANPGVKLVLGDPNGPAIGKISKKMLDNAGMWGSLGNNVQTYTLTVNQLLLYVATDQADATIIWEDMVMWEETNGDLVVVDIPPEKNLICTIPTAVSTNTHNLELAMMFSEFVTSERSLVIWDEWGFVAAEN